MKQKKIMKEMEKNMKEVKKLQRKARTFCLHGTKKKSYLKGFTKTQDGTKIATCDMCQEIAVVDEGILYDRYELEDAFRIVISRIKLSLLASVRGNVKAYKMAPEAQNKLFKAIETLNGFLDNELEIIDGLKNGTGYDEYGYDNDGFSKGGNSALKLF